MKTLSRLALIIILFACSFTRSAAQDTIIMTNGNIIPAKILEVSTEEVRYKRFDNIDGPVFITKTVEINKIKYQSGNTDVLNKPKTPVVVAPVDPNPPITLNGRYYYQGYKRYKEKEVHSILQKYGDSEINLHIKKAKSAKAVEYVGFVAIPALAFALGYTVYALVNNRPGRIASGANTEMSYTPGIGCGVLAVAAFATSMTFKIIRKSHNAAALRIYNEKY